MPGIIASIIGLIASLYIKYKIIKFAFNLLLIEILFLSYKAVVETGVNTLAVKLNTLALDGNLGYILYHSGLFEAFLIYLGIISTYSSYKFLFRMLSNLVG